MSSDAGVPVDSSPVKSSTDAAGAPTVDAEWTTRVQAGVTFVSLVVENRTPVARTVRVNNELDGPVLPPRTAGVPEAGWDEGGYRGRVEAADTVAVGYACPVRADGAPVAVVDEGPAGEDDGPAATPEAAVRTLGRPGPPRDAVPRRAVVRSDDAPGDGGADEGGDDVRAGESPVARCVEDASGASADATGRSREPEPDTAGREVDTDGGDEAADGSDGGDEAADVSTTSPGEDLPPAVGQWLADVEGRVERGERLTGASVAEATAVLSETGGLDTAAQLPETLAADARALRALARRATVLAARAESVGVPVESLRRLA
jgi:hypothetical protein